MVCKVKTIGIFSKLGMPGGSENRVTQLANSFSEIMSTYIFAEKNLSDKLKPQLNAGVILRENTMTNQQYQYELSGVDILIVVNSDSCSFCKPSYWDGTQAKHHTSNIDISQIPHLAFLFNYVVGPGANLFDLHKINPNIKILATSEWFVNLFNTETKFGKLRTLNLPIMSIDSPISTKIDVPKKPSDKIRINRHSMSFAYKHDEDNLIIVKELCKRYGDAISFNWMGVPDTVRDTNSNSKKDKVEYRKILESYSQMKISKTYSSTIADFLSETDIMFNYISRFRKEPWPRTTAEAMMASCCVVTNNNYGMAEQIDHERNGYLFDHTDHALQILCDLIDNPIKIRQMGSKAVIKAKDQFASDKIRDKMLKFICG